MTPIGNKLRLARHRMGYSLRDLAQHVGVSAMALSKYERGLMMPTSSVLLALTRVLDVTVAFLMTDLRMRFTRIEWCRHGQRVGFRDHDL